MSENARNHLVRPSAQALLRLRDLLSPGGAVANVRRLRGGLSAAMHTVDLVAASGERQRLVVRRFGSRHLGSEANLPLRSWQTLAALEELQVPAPRPVFLDGDGAVFGSPSLVMTRLPGRGVLNPSDLQDWLHQLGMALAALHSTSIDGYDLSFLSGPGGQLARRLQRWEGSREKLGRHPDAAAMMSALARWRDMVPAAKPVLTHGDFWPGNTLWLRGRLTALVDWDDAAVDSPGFDIGYCRIDLTLMIGRHAADGFLHAYESAMGTAVPQLFFWDLVGAARALPEPAVWLPGYRDLGRLDVDAASMNVRLREFIADALARAAAAETV